MILADAKPKLVTSGQYADNILKGFSGILQVDGYAGYNRLLKRTNNQVALAYCWTHARRKLHKVAQSGTTPIAEDGLKQFAALYRIEKDRGQKYHIITLALAHWTSPPSPKPSRSNATEKLYGQTSIQASMKANLTHCPAVHVYMHERGLWLAKKLLGTLRRNALTVSG